MLGTIIPTTTRALAAAAAARTLVASLMRPRIKTDLLYYMAKDIGGFEFDYIGDERLEAQSEITDHFTENNWFLQDHAALKPITLTCKGFVAETKQTKTQAVGFMGALMSQLAPVTPYLTRYTPGTAATMGTAILVATDVENKIRKALSIANSIGKLFSPLMKTRCQEAYAKLTSLRNMQYTFAVVTPFQNFKDMMITNITLVSPEDSRGITDVTVTLKEIRIVKAVSTKATQNLGATNGISNAAGPAGAVGRVS